MSVFLGSSERKNIYLGSTQIKKVYIGATQVYASYYTLSGSGSVYDYNDSNSSSLTASFNNNGTITWSGGADDPVVTKNIFAWHDGGNVSGIGDSRWAKKTFVSGDPTSGTLTTSLVALSSVKTVTISTVSGEGKSGNLLIEIYSDSGGTEKVGEITLQITATI
jgi:hypothetical protein